MSKSIERQLDECRDALRKANHRCDKQRFEFERQLGELRGLLAEGEQCVSLQVISLQASLDTATWLLRDIRQGVSMSPMLKRSVDAFLITASTEGKDEYCGDRCTAFDQVEDFTEGKDHEL